MGKVIKGAMLDRRQAVAELLRQRRDMLVVTGLGSASYDCMAAGDDTQNYYLWAAMGSAATVGFGLAMAQPSRAVLVVTGDGEMLMGLGALATIGQRLPPNLSIVVLDNGYYGETGMQMSHTGRGLELSEVAKACAFPSATVIGDIEGIEKLRSDIHKRSRAIFATVKVASDQLPRALPPRDAVYVKNRFRSALGFNPN